MTMRPLPLPTSDRVMWIVPRACRSCTRLHRSHHHGRPTGITRSTSREPACVSWFGLLCAMAHDGVRCCEQSHDVRLAAGTFWLARWPRW